ncbi:ABC transporter substrate-binding protein [Agarivorans sp. Toyoura001]|nr:ABC transporter substrate-binding protein [Agarivorans sp. Toyoura001]
MFYMVKSFRLVASVICGLLISTTSDAAEELGVETLALSQSQSLTLVLMPSSGKQREAYKRLIEQFSENYPDVAVGTLVYESEYYKKNIESILQSNDGEGDLFFWFGGERLRKLAEEDYLLDISSWWQKGEWSEKFSASSEQASQLNQAHFALPINYYQWGFYYRHSMIRHYPDTFTSWPQLLNTCQELAKQGRHLVSIGTKDAWPVAGWFDYINLRLNGLAFHQQLLAGEISFYDPRVEQVFSFWQQAISAQCFIPSSDQLRWKQALPAMYRGKAASVLMGNFFVATVPERVTNDLAFAAFPPLKAGQDYYEEAPIDVIVAHKQAEGNVAAYQFLDFLVSSQALVALNQDLGKINPLLNAPASSDKFIKEGEQLLRNAKGVSQFFDRDSPREFASPAMAVMVDFLEQRIDAKQAMQQIEAIRSKVFDSAD